jgi:D-glycero-alpha-D-manno-heptose 1-phosphate guanylyltransferase
LIKQPLIVLAGGFGTRLSAVVKEAPKPLAPVANRPFLYYLLQAWKLQGLRDFIFLIHFKADQMEAFLHAEKSNGILSDCELHIVHESEPLGTGGAVANAVKAMQLTESFLVANADTYMESGVKELLAEKTPAIATIGVENTGRYGAVRVQNGQVLSFEEKTSGAGPGAINAGMYHLEATMFSDWKGNAFSMEKDIFEPLVKQENLHAVEVDSVFIDIGIPEDYHRFCKWIEADKKNKL